MRSFRVAIGSYPSPLVSSHRKETIGAVLREMNFADDRSVINAHQVIVKMGVIDRFCDWAFHGGAKAEALDALATLIIHNARIARQQSDDNASNCESELARLAKLLSPTATYELFASSDHDSDKFEAFLTHENRSRLAEIIATEYEQANKPALAAMGYNRAAIGYERAATNYELTANRPDQRATNARERAAEAYKQAAVGYKLTEQPERAAEARVRAAELQPRDVSPPSMFAPPRSLHTASDVTQNTAAARNVPSPVNAEPRVGGLTDHGERERIASSRMVAATDKGKSAAPESKGYISEDSDGGASDITQHPKAGPSRSTESNAHSPSSNAKSLVARSTAPIKNEQFVLEENRLKDLLTKGSTVYFAHLTPADREPWVIEELRLEFNPPIAVISRDKDKDKDENEKEKKVVEIKNLVVTRDGEKSHAAKVWDAQFDQPWRGRAERAESRAKVQAELEENRLKDLFTKGSTVYFAHLTPADREPWVIEELRLEFNPPIAVISRDKDENENEKEVVEIKNLVVTRDGEKSHAAKVWDAQFDQPWRGRAERANRSLVEIQAKLVREDMERRPLDVPKTWV